MHLKETVLSTLHLQVLLPDGDGYGQWYWPLRSTQKPRGDFFVASEMPGYGQRAAR